MCRDREDPRLGLRLSSASCSVEIRAPSCSTNQSAHIRASTSFTFHHSLPSPNSISPILRKNVRSPSLISYYPLSPGYMWMSNLKTGMEKMCN
jgi:hypothetical protein